MHAHAPEDAAQAEEAPTGRRWGWRERTRAAAGKTEELTRWPETPVVPGAAQEPEPHRPVVLFRPRGAGPAETRGEVRDRAVSQPRVLRRMPVQSLKTSDAYGGRERTTSGQRREGRGRGRGSLAGRPHLESETGTPQAGCLSPRPERRGGASPVRGGTTQKKRREKGRGAGGQRASCWAQRPPRRRTSGITRSSERDKTKHTRGGSRRTQSAEAGISPRRSARARSSRGSVKNICGACRTWPDGGGSLGVPGSAVGPSAREL